MKAALLLFVAVLGFGSCQTPPSSQPAATPKQVAPVPAAQNATDTAQANVDESKDERDARLLANIDHARERNQDNVDGTPKTVVDGDLEVAQGLLKDVTRDPLEYAARQRDAALVEAGRAAEARANYAKAAEDANVLVTKIAQLEMAADLARAAEIKAVADLVEQAEKNRVSNERIVKDLNAKHQLELDAEKKKMVRYLTLGLYGLAALLTLIGVFIVYSKVQAMDIPKAAIAGAVFGGGAAFAIACAWTINQSWFKWVVIIGGGGGVLAVTLYVVNELREAREKRTLKVRSTEANEAEDALRRMISVLDEEDAKSPLFSKLSGAMNDNHKALIKELQAEMKREKAAVTTPDQPST